MAIAAPIKWLFAALAITVVVMGLASCSQRSTCVLSEAMADYEQALVTHLGDPDGIDIGLARFQETYQDLAVADLSERVGVTYAETFFFNDTLHSFHDRATLQAYMSQISTQLEHSAIEVHQVVVDGADVFVRWRMHFASASMESNSIGMSHLRFNQDGEVVLHQDFWDSGHGLYAHLPVVGFLVRRVRQML